MTDSVVVVEYGSHTFRAGLAYNFPSDQEPRLVRLHASLPCILSARFTDLCLLNGRKQLA